MNIEEEIEKRIEELEKIDYDFPERFSKKDYIITGMVILICIVLIIMGGYL